MPPLSTVFTLRNFYVYVSLLNSHDVAFYVEASIDEAFSLAFALDILDVQPNDGHV